MAGIIRVGTSSWSDPGLVRDWYPKKLPAVERLKFYSQYFNLVEVNTSFYGVPTPLMCRRWAGQTPGDFVFDVKLHRFLSRHHTPPEAIPASLRAQAQVRGGAVVLTPELEEAVAGRFLEAITPLAEAGKLGVLLLQLAPSFAPERHRLEELNGLFATLHGWPVAVELRHRAWVAPGQLEKTKRWFQEQKATFVCVDTPEEDHVTVMPPMDLVTEPHLAYLRLHGRNGPGFVKGKSVAERFDYDYSERELVGIVKRAWHLASQVDELHLLYNNNNSNYALKAAARTLELIASRHPESLLPRQGPKRPELAGWQQVFDWG